MRVHTVMVELHVAPVDRTHMVDVLLRNLPGRTLGENILDPQAMHSLYDLTVPAGKCHQFVEQPRRQRGIGRLRVSVMIPVVFKIGPELERAGVLLRDEFPYLLGGRAHHEQDDRAENDRDGVDRDQPLQNKSPKPACGLAGVIASGLIAYWQAAVHLRVLPRTACRRSVTANGLSSISGRRRDEILRTTAASTGEAVFPAK